VTQAGLFERYLTHEDWNRWCRKGRQRVRACGRGSRECPQIVILDRTRKRAKAVATDLLYGSPLGPKTEVVDGDYDDLAGAALVMITAGINRKSRRSHRSKRPQGRLRLLDTNAGIYREIVPRIVRAAPRPSCWL